MSATAYPLLVLAMTGSPAEAGVVAFLATFPALLFQLPAGALVDRSDRRRLMLACDLGRMVALGSLAGTVWFGQLTIVQVGIVAFVEGTLSVFFQLAEAGAVRYVVTPEQLNTALSQNEARVQGAALVGQPFGGALFEVGRALPFIADAVSYCLSVLTLVLIRGPLQEARAATQQHLLRDIGEGLGWLWRQPFLRATVLLVGASNAVFQGLVLVVIVLARGQGASGGTIGLILSAAGGGGVLGALSAPWVQRRVSPTIVVVGASWIWAALVPLVAVAPGPIALGAIFCLIAFLGPAWNVAIGTYQMLLTPDAMVGRVMSAGGLFSFGAIPLGSLAAGVLLEKMGSTSSILVLSAVLVVLAAVATASRSIRDGVRLPA